MCVYIYVYAKMYLNKYLSICISILYMHYYFHCLSVINYWVEVKMCGVNFFSYKIKFIFLISFVGNFGYKMRIKGHLFKQISFFSSSVNFASSQLSLQSTKTIFFPSEPKPPFTTLTSSCSFTSQNRSHHLQG